MKALAELLIAALDLLRAEGLELRRTAFNLGLTLSLVLVFAIVLLLGIAMLSFWAFVSLEAAWGTAPAALVCGIAGVAVAGGGLWLLWIKNGVAGDRS